MILDHISNIKNYLGLSTNMDTAINFLIKTDLSDMEVGKYLVDGDNVYYMIQEYETKTIDNGKFEAHKRYMDIQLILKGQELIGYAPTMSLSPMGEYDTLKDKILLEGQKELHRLHEGMFGVYFPEDGHMPSINNVKTKVKKAVLKIKL